MKKKFGSLIVNRKRKVDKASSSTNENGDAPKAKQAKTDDKNDTMSQQEEIRQKKVFLKFSSLLIF